MSRPLKVFLCHASEDKPTVRELYKELIAQGIDVWLDEESLLPGQDWHFEIPGALKDADAVIVCLSSASITKEGYVQKEIRFAIDIAQEKPEGIIFIIPVRLQKCEIPERLKKWQWVDLFDKTGYDRLLNSLAVRARMLNVTPPAGDSLPAVPNLQSWANIKFVHIPAGSFIMGSKDENLLASEIEKPQCRVELLYNFYIGRYPVTNAQYNQFILATQPHSSNDWQKRPDYPAANITWYAAQDFCQWLNQTIGEKLPENWHFHLPNEAEWEKAARGEYGNEWPWGNEWDPNLCNSRENDENRVTHVGYYSPSGDSPYGVADMAGNVWEWTLNLWGTEESKLDYRYPYESTDGREKITANSNLLRVLRGGSFQDFYRHVRCASRRGGYPLMGWASSGFRVACSALK